MSSAKDEVSIAIRQPGNALHDISLVDSFFERTGNWAGKKVSRTKMLQAILYLAETSGQNPFDALFEKSLQVELSGFRADVNPTNTFISSQTNRFELIDQTSPDRQVYEHDTFPIFASDIYRLRNHILKDMLGCDPTLIDDAFDQANLRSILERMSPAEKDVFDKAYAQVVRLVNDATANAERNYVTGNKPISELTFSTYKENDVQYSPIFGRTCSTKAVKLDDPPHVLVERLRELKAFALGEQPSRA